MSRAVLVIAAGACTLVYLLVSTDSDRGAVTHSTAAATWSATMGKERSATVALDRGPRRPNEHPDRYRDRIWFAKHFDAFVRESGATDAQVQRLLLAIYDFTAHRTYLWDILRHEIRESGRMDEDRVLELLGDSLRQLAQAEQRILTGPQLSIYHDHCGYCAQRLATAEYDEPVLQVKLTDEEGR